MRLMLSLLAVLWGCDGSEAPDVTPEPAPTPAPAPVVKAVTGLDDASLKADPMAVLRVADAPLTDVPTVLGWMAVNPKVYDYLPASVQADPVVAERAVSLGYARGISLTADVTARSAPRTDAPAAKLPSDATNGYITGPRGDQQHAAGERLAVLETSEDGTWLRISEEKVADRVADRETYEMCDNLGQVAFEDFTFARDAGWIPAASTAPAVLAPRCQSKPLTFQSVENGDLAVYVSFAEVSFESFDDHAYTLLAASEAGTLKPGDTLQVIWCDDAIVWLPLSQ
ncbi:MAG: hypothetical protein ACI8RZ_001490 [Myxococcota bacterium]|jgi:hypothetical protein